VGPRGPSVVLVVDTNILLGVALGSRARPTFDAVRAKRRLVTSARARDELLGLATNAKRKVARAAQLASAVLDTIAVIDEHTYTGRLGPAAVALRLAPASRNGSTDDAHILALAWVLDADIWSHDRDFAGTGWPSWSSANLGTALADP
jgi:predicted nucleic acid-binding protein